VLRERWQDGGGADSSPSRGMVPARHSDAGSTVALTPDPAGIDVIPAPEPR